MSTVKFVLDATEAEKELKLLHQKFNKFEDTVNSSSSSIASFSDNFAKKLQKDNLATENLNGTLKKLDASLQSIANNQKKQTDTKITNIKRFEEQFKKSITSAYEYEKQKITKNLEVFRKAGVNKEKLLILEKNMLNDLSAKYEKVNSKLRGTGTTAKNAGVSVTGLITIFGGFYAVNTALNSITDGFKRMETAELEVLKTTGLTKQGLKDLTSELDSLSLDKGGFLVTDLYKIAEVAGQLGIKGKEDLKSFTVEMQYMASSSTLTAEQSSIGFAKLSNSLKKPVSEVNQLTSTMSKLASSTTATEQVLLDVTQRIAGVGHTVGYSNSALIALSATMSDVGIGVEVSGSSMSQIMALMAKNTEDFALIAGVSFTDFEEVMKDKPIKALELFLSGMDKLDQKDKFKALEALHINSNESINTVFKLSAAVDKLEENLQTANKAYEDGTATQKEYDVASKSLEQQQKRAESAVLQMQRAIGEELKPTMLTYNQLVIDGSGYISEHSSQLLVFAGVTGTVTTAWLVLNSAFLATPFGVLIAGLGTVIATATFAYNTISNMFDMEERRAKGIRDLEKKVNAGTHRVNEFGQTIEIKTENQKKYNKALKDEIALKKAMKSTQNNKFLNQEQKNNALVSLGKEYTKASETIRKYGKEFKKDVTETVAKTKELKTTIKKIENIKISTPKIPTHTKPLIKGKTPKKHDYVDAYKKDETDFKRSQQKKEREQKITLEKMEENQKTFDDMYRKTTLDSFEYDRYKLEERFKDLKGQNLDKLELDVWYKKELEKINMEESTKRDEVAKKEQAISEKKQKEATRVIEENAKKKVEAERTYQVLLGNSAYEENIKYWELKNKLAEGGIELSIREIKALEQQVKLNEKLANIGRTALNSTINSILHGANVGDALTDSLDGIFSTATDSLSGDIADGIVNGFNFDVASMGMNLGLMAGAYFGKEILNSMSNALFGGKKSQYAVVNTDGSIMQKEHTSGGILRHGRTKEVATITHQINALEDSYESFLKMLTGSVIDLTLAVGKYSDITKTLTQQFFDEWSGVSVSDINERRRASGEIFGGRVEEMSTRIGLDPESVRQLDVSDELMKSWEDYAKSVDKSVTEVIGEVLGSMATSERNRFNHLNKDNKIAIIENDINIGAEREKKLEERLANGADINLDNFDKYIENIKDPVLLQQYNNLSAILVQNATNADLLAETLKKQNEEYLKSISDFNNLGLSDSEKFKKDILDIDNSFKELGVATPTTVQGLKDYVATIDDTTEAGRKLKADVMALGSTFLSVAEQTRQAQVTAYNESVSDSQVTAGGFSSVYAKIKSYNEIIKQSEDAKIKNSLASAKIASENANKYSKYLSDISTQTNKMIESARKTFTSTIDELNGYGRTDKENRENQLILFNREEKKFTDMMAKGGNIDKEAFKNSYDKLLSLGGDIGKNIQNYLNGSELNTALVDVLTVDRSKLENTSLKAIVEAPSYSSVQASADNARLQMSSAMKEELKWLNDIMLKNRSIYMPEDGFVMNFSKDQKLNEKQIFALMGIADDGEITNEEIEALRNSEAGFSASQIEALYTQTNILNAIANKPQPIVNVVVNVPKATVMQGGTVSERSTNTKAGKAPYVKSRRVALPAPKYTPRENSNSWGTKLVKQMEELTKINKKQQILLEKNERSNWVSATESRKSRKILEGAE